MVATQLLIIDDSDDDAVLIAATLQAASIDIAYRRVDSEPAMRGALADRIPDLVISDYHLPGFTAEAALQILLGTGHDVPFILISGQIGEDAAVSMMRAGARDFVRKDHLGRLAPAVVRELDEAGGRRRRRAAEQALRDSERRYRILTEQARDVIFHCDLRPAATLTYLNPAAVAITGHPVADLLGPARLFLEHVPDPDQRARLAASWESPEPEPLVFTWLRPDATTAWLEQRAHAVVDGSGTLVAVEGVLRDISERVAAEHERESLIRQVEQAQRVESLGLLAGGVAHDFNNALAVILGAIAFLRDDIAADHPAQEDVERIRTAAERSAALTRQLLIFARREPAETEILDINAVIADIADLIRRTIGEDIRFTYHAAPGELLVTADRSRIEQVILNLGLNSRAAMPDGGSLRIDTAVTVISPGSPPDPRLALPPGDYVTVAVTDTGTGMTPEVASRAFEPFFTTKPRGEGTGLGLAAAHGVVTASGGHIRLTTEPGRGTSVRLYLPRTAATALRHLPDGPPVTVVEGAAETILVVEDENPVRDVVTRMLTRHNYRVVAAASGAEALRLYERSPGVIVGVLTDIVMPEMSGVQLVERLRAKRPDLPVLFMSGYTADHALDENGTASLIRKPFNERELLAALDKALAATHLPNRHGAATAMPSPA